ncbi:nucleotide sugar dehydrogenase [Nocardia panacis]|uniref:UDP-glucose 6-dehydrogenase n=2 Tax=Nocardia panacis TaxID=2340916 RepID=A0A3A4K5A1_9NOCA|nr:nucleotide sugar dehydrogenase [Nocardia panacis]
MAISVFGLGYVGCVSAACLAARGNSVVGVDVNPEKTEFIRQGRAPVVEERIGELTAEMVAAGRLTVTEEVAKAVLTTDISIICVGTPSGSGGSLSTQYLERVSAEIGAALANKDGWHIVAYRSTMVPGTCGDILIPILEQASGKTAGMDFGVCVNPEFLREGSSVRDFENPPKTVIGASDERTGTQMTALYAGLPGPRFLVPISVAEMTKYVDNSFHALKVTFGNEIGALCAELGLDSHAVMDIFLADTKLNISPAYLRPGFAFGGSCLPKDVRALTHTARRHDLELPVLQNVLASNEAQLRRAVELVMSLGRRRIGIFGLSFKAGTDDLRESPMVEFAERLIGKGYDVRIYDAHVALSRLMGANRAFIEDRLPHLGDLLTDDIAAVVAHGEVFVAGTAEPEVVAAIDGIAPDRTVIDLVRLPGAAERRLRPGYLGIGW